MLWTGLVSHSKIIHLELYTPCNYAYNDYHNFCRPKINSSNCIFYYTYSLLSHMTIKPALSLKKSYHYSSIIGTH